MTRVNSEGFGYYRPTLGTVVMCNDTLIREVLNSHLVNGLMASHFSGNAEMTWRDMRFPSVCYEPTIDPYSATHSEKELSEPVPLKYGAIEIRVIPRDAERIGAVLVACNHTVSHLIVDTGHTHADTKLPTHTLVNFNRSDTLGDVIKTIKSIGVDEFTESNGLAALAIVVSYFSSISAA